MSLETNQCSFAGACLFAVFLAPTTLQAAEPGPVSFKIPARLPDQAEVIAPANIRLEGFLGRRVANNATNRLARVDVEPLLAGFRKKPGTHPWIGEHIGKWMHAATLAWAYTGETELRKKLDYAAAELIKAQEPDGYLGTYVPEKRFGLYQGADWDVWSHKYCLIGLLTYYQYTGNTAALDASRKAADLLIATFPAKKSILAAGTHVGMAATSVLEPMVLLYRFTGEQKYLDFALYIVKSWDEPNGPKIIASLLKEKQVNKTANAKAYEMLSNLVGLCELARATGDRAYLEPVLIAWQDIVSNRLYLTGGASQGEHFKDDHHLPNGTGAHVAETCVTTTWIQLNWQLLRLTGESRFMNHLETTFYNHLAAAQRPDGAQWCYFTSLEGTKPYGPGINCCVSSGPRGMALAPLSAFMKTKNANGGDVLLVNLLENGKAIATLGGQTVTVTVSSEFGEQGTIVVKVETPAPATFDILVRCPGGLPTDRLQIGGQQLFGGNTAQHEGFRGDFGIRLGPRQWQNGDQETIRLSPTIPTVVVGRHGNLDRACLQYGPWTLAYDAAKNPGLPSPTTLGFANANATNKPGVLEFVAHVRSARNPNPQPAVFVPFADAGATGGRYQVWLYAPGAEIPANDSLFAGAAESRSRKGNQPGSVCDGDATTFAVTFDGTLQAEDWFAVELEEPASIKRVVYSHGKNFHDGGWFDAASGKPRLEIQRTKQGVWESLGSLADYPDTTATDNRGLKDGQKFTLTLPEPVKATGLRVIGKPACGDNPKQAFSSCAELQAFDEPLRVE